MRYIRLLELLSKHQENIPQLLALNNIDSLCKEMIRNVQPLQVTK